MTTAAVVAYYDKEREARISYAGHPPVLYKRASDREWSFARSRARRGMKVGSPTNIPLAVDPDTFYGQITVPMAAGDRLFIYTDGVIDAPGQEDEFFGLARLKDVLDEHANAPLQKLKSAVLDALHQHVKSELTHDDVTLIALEVC